MQALAIAFEERLKQHDTGQGHPERPSRLDAVRAGLEESELLAFAAAVSAAPLSRVDAELVHTPAYLDRLRVSCEAGRRMMDDPDCPICPASDESAYLAAGMVTEAARMVASGQVRRAFCGIRPPGHHAERDRAMGFCLLNNIAIAAEVVRRDFGFSRIAIVDWDVHHGNGTQHVFEESNEVLFISLHGHPATLYPGTGYSHESGRGRGEGFTLNVPLDSGTEHDEFLRAMDERVIPRLDRFTPQILFISAGFDAHADDPLGNLRLTDETFRLAGARLLEIAKRHCDGRVVSVLEGGYNLDVLRRCTREHVRALAG